MKKGTGNVVILFILIQFVINSAIFALPPAKGGASNCLWKITNAHNEVYLLGSIHFLKEDNYPLAPVIEKAFEKSQVVAFEVNIDSATLGENQQLLMTKGIFQDGNTLQNVLKEATYQKLAAKIESYGASIAPFNRFKPWFVTMTLMTMELQRIGFNPQFGLDQYFFQKAKTAGKKYLGLERIGEQIELFDELVQDDQEQLVLQTIKEIDVIQTEVEAIVTAWQKGDTSGLEDSILKSFREYPDIEKKFLTDRNKNWLPQIERFCKQKQNHIVIVGAGHLVGKNGLVKMLQAKGYSIKQL